MDKITDSHEWVKKEQGFATVGITKKAVKELGEIVYVELPACGDVIAMGEAVVVLESTKAAVDSYAPVKGEVIAINERLKTQPDLVNKDPEGAGWLYKVKIS